MITVRARKVTRINGTRYVHANLVGRIELWAQCYNTTVYACNDPLNHDWVIIKFDNPACVSLFALSFEENLELSYEDNF